MKCPGQDSRYWKPGAIFEAKCPQCGHPVEFFKDDVSRLCSKCGRRFLNPGLDFGCASYCKYAEQCLGALSPELIAQKESLLKDRVAIEVKRCMGRDFKGIGLAVKTARHAETIGKEEGGNLAAILPSAYLYPLAGGEEGLDAAREILKRSGASDALTEEILQVLKESLSPREAGSDSYKILHDAHLTATLEENGRDGGDRPLFSAEDFLTESGRELAGRLAANLKR